jgi:hypothetical protein
VKKGVETSLDTARMSACATTYFFDPARAVATSQLNWTNL